MGINNMHGSCGFFLSFMFLVLLYLFSISSTPDINTAATGHGENWSSGLGIGVFFCFFPPSSFVFCFFLFVMRLVKLWLLLCFARCAHAVGLYEFDALYPDIRTVYLWGGFARYLQWWDDAIN